MAWSKTKYIHSSTTKVGAILKKVSIEAIPMLYYLGKVSIKQLYHFKSQKFWTMKQYKYFYVNYLNRQSDCIVSKPRIFKGEAIQVLLRQKNWIVKAIVSFQTSECLKMKRYKYFYTQKFESMKRLYCFKPQNLLAMKRYNYFYYYFLGGWGNSDLIVR